MIISSYAKVLTTNFCTYFGRICVNASRIAFDITADMDSLCSSWGIRVSREFLSRAPQHNPNDQVGFYFVPKNRAIFVLFILTARHLQHQGLDFDKEGPNILVE